MAQAVSRRAFTAEARVRNQASPMHGLRGGKRGIWTAYVSSTSVFASVIPSMLSHVAVTRRTEPAQSNSLLVKQQHGVPYSGTVTVSVPQEIEKELH